MYARGMARGLAWFGIGLGLIEFVAPRAVARAAGLEGYADLIQVFGIREIGSGAAILASDDPETWLWSRVVGDGLDGALLARGLSPDNPERDRTLMAVIALAPIVVLDVLYARKPG